MAFKKGKPKTGGRKPGTPNKVANDLRDKITTFLDNEFEGVKLEFKTLSARDKLRFFSEMLGYAVPKLQSTSLDIDFDSLSESDLDEIITRLLAASKK